MPEPDTLSERQSQLSPAKRALVEKWMRGKFTTERPAIPPRPPHEPVPLSFAQQRLWFLDQLVPDSPAYNVYSAVRLTGRLDVTLLERSLNEIVRRHEALRTTFPSVDGQPSQIIAPALVIAVPIVDLQECPGDRRDDLAFQLAAEEVQRPFDLARGPLLRAALLRLGQAEHIVLVTMHHIISDGWSIGLFIHEMKTLYKAFAAGQRSPLPELPIQYADFAHWQRQWLAGERAEAQLAYWRDQIGDAPPTLELPGDRPRPAIQTFRGAHQSFELPPSLSSAIKALSRREGVTSFMILLAAFKALLYRYTRQKDILIGSPIANRNRVEIEGLIGFFVNTLVLRTRFDDAPGSPSFRELLRRVRETTLGAYAHQDLPFERLVEEVQPGRDTSRNPLFQVMFVLQNTPTSAPDPSGLSFELLDVHNQTAKFDLWLSMEERADQLSGIVEYSTELFDAATIDRLLGHFQTVLAAAVADPEQSLSDLPLLTQAERHQVLLQWNDTRTADIPDSCLHELFEVQAHKTPDAIAVVYPADGSERGQDQQVSYAVLNARANQLAHHLRRLGVGSEVLVGVFMERSVEMVLALLATLKAGGAYVPLDPSYPQERLDFMLEDARAPVVLTQAHLVDRLPATHSIVIQLDADWPSILNSSFSILHSSFSPDNLAYAIYTSGSTGQPKGALNTHRGICNRIVWMQSAYQLTQADRVLQKTPFSFDVSVWEFFWPLLTGASLVMARPEGHKDSAYLVGLIDEQAITTLHFVPSMLQVFLEESIETCSSLKRVICSGEALPFDLQERFFARHGAELHNLYGPTEAAVDVTFWACRRGDRRRAVPIGRPIANTQIYLLDPQLNPVPIGVPGELHIGGIGLARGYLNRPDLTAERFIPTPPFPPPSLTAGDTGGGRLYKTGDLARWLPDESIEFLGRLDHQVKIRGLRIELGEIETVLRQHSTVWDATVLSRDSEQIAGHKQLVAYVIPDANAQQAEAPSPQEQISEWRQVFDQTYSQTATSQDPTFNIVGWNSSYTGLPLPAEEMREWVDRTVERVLALHPRRALEIGCGTGLLLFRIAPSCERYWGTDFSPTALGYIHSQLIQPGRELPHVQLLQKSADDFDGFQSETFDAVILNSVVQYFPGVDYLLRVLKGALQVLAPRGFVFLGDVRSLPLLEAFHTSVELERAPASLPVAHLRQRVLRRMSQEQELILDPAFFFDLQHTLPQIGHVEIRLKRSRAHNELTRFRYDVLLHSGSDAQPVAARWLDWQKEALTVNDVRRLLLDSEPGRLGIARVPNARLSPVMYALNVLARPDCPESVGELRQNLQAGDRSDDAVDPEEWWAMADELPYDVEVYESGAEAGDYNVVLKRRTASPETILTVMPDRQPTIDSQRSQRVYANNPLQAKLAEQIAIELRRHLKLKLPEYMIPSAFVFMDAWPLTSSGKLDRRALPAPLQADAKAADGFAAARTPAEKTLAAIWRQVLNLEQVGVTDNFFDLGGDSILGVRVIARANKMGIPLTAQHLFRHQTIAELAEVAGSIEPQPTPQPVEPHPGFPLVTFDRHKIDQVLADQPDVEDIYPIAPYQEYMLWRIVSEREPGLFVFQRVDAVPMMLDRPALERALRWVIERHACLRTSFVWGGDLDEPLQVIHRRGTEALEYQDWRGLSATEQAQRLEACVEAERLRSFPLTEPIGIRLFVARTAENVCQLVLTASYMRMDGWSAILVTEEIVALYRALRTGGDLQRQLPPPYRQYIAWLKEQDQGRAEAFWRQNLKGFTSPTPLVKCASGNRPKQGEGLARQHVYLPAPMTAGLQSLAQQHRLTLSTLFQGAWALLLSRYTGREDVMFGLTVSGRPPTLSDVEAMVGPTLNTLPRRVQTPPEATLSTWLKELMEQQAALSQYEYSRLRRIHEWSEVPEDLPLFESVLVMQNLSTDTSKAAHQGYAQIGCPLRVDVFPYGEIGLVMYYNRNSFDAATVNRMIEDLQIVLKGCVANPEQRLADVMRSIALY